MSNLKPTYKSTYTSENADELVNIYSKFCDHFYGNDAANYNFASKVATGFLMYEGSRTLSNFYRNIDRLNNSQIILKAAQRGGEFVIPNASYFVESDNETKRYEGEKLKNKRLEFQHELFAAVQSAVRSVDSKLSESEKESGEMSL